MNVRADTHPVRTASLALSGDVALVLLFAGLGRSSHDRTTSVLGLLETAWPFLAGLAFAWLTSRAWRRPLAPLRTGVPVWLGAATIGLLLRVVTGAGIALPFVIVAVVTLAVFLVGWRGISALLLHGRTRN